MTTNELLRRHTDLSGQLADKLRELGDARQAHIIATASAWNSAMATTMGVTERREAVRHSVANFAAPIERDLGEIEAMRVELNALEWQLRFTSDEPKIDNPIAFLNNAAYGSEA